MSKEFKCNLSMDKDLFDIIQYLAIKMKCDEGMVLQKAVALLQAAVEAKAVQLINYDDGITEVINIV